MAERNMLRSSTDLDEASGAVLDALKQPIYLWVDVMLTYSPGSTTSSVGAGNHNRRRLMEESILPTWNVICNLVEKRRNKPLWFADLKYRIDILTELYVSKPLEPTDKSYKGTQVM